MDRIFKIIELLLNCGTPVSVDYIADHLKVSNKTIRNDFQKIEQIIKDANLRLAKKPGVGIVLEGPEENKLELMKSIKDSVSYIEPYSPEDRINYILKALFMSKTSITVKELSQSLYVSRVTIQKDLEKVEEWLNKFDLILKKKPNYGMEIMGGEENWRKAIASLLASNKGYDELKELLYDEYEGKIDYKSMSRLKELINIDYRVLERIVMDAEAKLKFKFSDEAFVSLIMHIAISIKRLKEGKDIKLSYEMLKSLKENKEYGTAELIAKDIENSFRVKLPESEVGYILLHILGTKLLEGKSGELNIDFERQGDNELAVIMAKDIIGIADRALRLNLKEDKQLFNGLILHLRPTINRLKYGLTLRNPILKEIKENYTEIYGAAWMTSTTFEKYLGVKMPEEEIGYICLHLAASVERNKNPLKTLIVCASGIGTSQFVAARLERNFRQINIVDVISIIELKRRKLDGIDIVISTVPVEVNKPVLMISPLLNQNDIRRIELFIDTITQKGNRNIAKDSIVEEDLIRVKKSSESRESLIKEICEDLVSSNYVQKDFVDSVLERERIYPTALGRGISIPHGDPRYVNRSCIAVNILKESIDWAEEKVDIVFMLCINEEDVGKSKKLVRSLYNFIDNDENLNLLKSASSGKEISTIMEGIENVGE